MKEHFERLSAENWGILEGLLTHASAIDLGRLAITDRDDAVQFLRSYGYSLSNPEEAAEVERMRREALAFIQRVFLDSLGPEYEPLILPDLIRNAGILELLLLASCSPDEEQQRWACAVLRVMHTSAHTVSELSMHFFPSIMDQILAPYYAHIRPDNGQMWLGQDSSFRLPLVDFQVKAGKERDSALLKLLHKPENVAADIFDRIGVRFITRDRLDAVLVLHYLREKNLVAFPNIKASTARNTLLDVVRFRRTFRHLRARYEANDLSLPGLEQTLRAQAQLSVPAGPRGLKRLFSLNPHSSEQYRSIQFTVRQLVRLVNPLYSAIDLLELRLDEQPELQPRLREPLAHARPHYRFFFPYEIQIIDEETHQQTLEGHGSHAAYKQRQLEAARKRVLGPLLIMRTVRTEPRKTGTAGAVQARSRKQSRHKSRRK